MTEGVYDTATGRHLLIPPVGQRHAGGNNSEQDKSRPNALQVQLLAVLKDMTHNEVLARLEVSAAG